MNKYLKYLIMIIVWICMVFVIVGVHYALFSYSEDILITGGSEFERNEVRNVLSVVDDSTKKRVASIHITDKHLVQMNRSADGHVEYLTCFGQPYLANIIIKNNTSKSIYYLTLHEVGHVYCCKNENDMSEECADWYVTRLLIFNISYTFSEVWT